MAYFSVGVVRNIASLLLTHSDVAHKPEFVGSSISLYIIHNKLGLRWVPHLVHKKRSISDLPFWGRIRQLGQGFLGIRGVAQPG
jgi:hypothetical protein